MIVGSPVPWNSLDNIEPGAQLEIGDGDGTLDLDELLSTMEAIYDRLPPAARDAWAAIWSVVRGPGEVEVPGAIAFAAFDAIVPAVDEPPRRAYPGGGSNT